MLFTIISVGLGCAVAYPISKILDQKKRRITYWVAGVLGFFLVTVVMMAWANTLDQNVVGAPGASGLYFALGLGMVGWQLGRSQGKSGTHDSVRDQESRGGYDISKFIRLAGIVLLVILTAGAVGIAKALVGEGAVPWYLPIIVAAVLGAFIGAIIIGNRSSKSGTVGTESVSESNKTPQHLSAPISAVDEEWDILSKYDNEVRAAMNIIRLHGESAVEELRKAHRVINDKSQLSRIASEIDKNYRASIAEQKARKEKRKTENAPEQDRSRDKKYTTDQETIEVKSDLALMAEYGITLEGEKYQFETYRYAKLEDAVNYARSKRDST